MQSAFGGLTASHTALLKATVWRDTRFSHIYHPYSWRVLELENHRRLEEMKDGASLQDLSLKQSFDS